MSELDAAMVLHACEMLKTDPDTCCPGFMTSLVQVVARKGTTFEIGNSVRSINALKGTKGADAILASDLLTDLGAKLCAEIVCFNEADIRGCVTDVIDFVTGLAVLRDNTLKQSEVVLFQEICAYLPTVWDLPEDSQERSDCVGPEEFAELMWCFQETHFVPFNFDQLVQVMLELNLCLMSPDDDLSVKSMRKILYACVSLGVELSASTFQQLFDQVLSRLHISTSHLCHVAWSLAAVNKLTAVGFESILRKLYSEANFSVDHLGFQKLCQASHSVQTSASDDTDLQSAWERLCSRFYALELPATEYHSPAGSLVRDALRHLKLDFEQDATLGEYQPDAILHQTGGSSALIMVATNTEDYAVSDPESLLGSTVFRHTLLAKQGSVMVISYSKLTSDTSTNAAYIQARLEEEVGYPTDKAFGAGARHA